MAVKNRKKFSRNASKLLSGLEEHPEVPVTHVPLGILAGVLELSTETEGEFQICRGCTQDAQKELVKVRMECAAWATTARDTLRPFMGPSGWNINWASAGWTTRSVAIPQSVDGLLELLPKISKHLEKNPRRENAEPEVKVTAVEATRLLKKLEAANKALSKSEVAQRIKRDAREAADADLGEKMATLRKELDAALKPRDPRWLEFIGDIPGDPQRPEVVTDLTVTPGQPGELNVEFNGGLRGERFQVEMLVVGQDKEFRRVVTVRDENATLKGLPPGSQVQVRVTGANKVGEGPACAPVTVQVPALAVAA